MIVPEQTGKHLGNQVLPARDLVECEIYNDIYFACGLRDINENSIDRQIARNLDRDDIVASTMTTFAGLTVHCARCHDHKFDPITQADYYSLQAVFAGIDKAQRVYDPDPVVAKKTIIFAIGLANDSRIKG